MPNDAIRLMMEEGRRLLARQETDLDTLRNRVATVLTGASIVAAVFGGALNETNAGDDTARVVAFVLFGLTVAVCIGILYPVEWKFSEALQPWLDKVGKVDEMSVDDVAFSLANTFEKYRGKNAPKIRCRQNWFAVACLLLGAQVIAWAFVVV